MKISDSIHCKRQRFDHLPNSSVAPRKKRRALIINRASIYIKPLGLSLVSTTTDSSSESICLEPYRPYTVGRCRQRCDFVFEDHRVSKRHCQVLFDALNRKIYIADGLFWFGSSQCSRVRVSLNGVFVNGVRIGRGEVSELGAGDQVSLVCGSEGVCNLGVRIGFVVQRIVFVEEVFDVSVSTLGANGLSSDYAISGSKCSGVTARVNLLLSRCRQILHSNDPIFCISRRMDNDLGLTLSHVVKSPVVGVTKQRTGASVDFLSGEGSESGQRLENANSSMLELNSVTPNQEATVVSVENPSLECDDVNGNQLRSIKSVEAPLTNNVASGKPKMALHLDTAVQENVQFPRVTQDKSRSTSIPSPGNKFYLNRLQFMGHGSGDHHPVVSLPELLYPIESLLQIFIATFTSDILWFLSYCEIPAHLPVTVACHDRERCWSSSPDKRIFVPYSDFPNLVVVCPPFPEVVAFGKDRKKLGIACHHPKLFVLQREDSIRVIITSANLVAKQWNSVTNTVWWQDFPRGSMPDYLSLFTQLSDGDTNQDSKSDFAAQLAGFMASLIVDAPCQAHWILELSKYDFKGAVVYLVASIPGIHSRRAPSTLESMYFLPKGKHCASESNGMAVLGSVETSVVGLSHLFHTSADSNGAQLKKLASFLGKCHENANGMLEVVLRRNTNIPVDVNAVSILVPNPEDLSEGDCVQLGFVPRNVAKWIAPLSDAGLFRFSGYVYAKEVLVAALEGSSGKVELLLYVSQGPAFSDISRVVQSEHVSAICSLVASIQRCTGLWRLEEVLSRHKWPEYLETDFVFGSSSIGSVNAHFLSAFSAAAGKTSVQLSESEESDPDWGCWSASQELRNPSIRIIFPTIERVKNARCGILASKHLLCFSQKTWLRLSNVDILHDAIPCPNDRVNHPMHVKVARRRFQSKKDASSFGWVYCGSHNFSAAAWGRPLCSSLGINANGVVKKNSVLGSRLHICNYELGIIFIVPPSDTRGLSLDDITLPFVVPAPKYRPSDRPATAQAMREALAELEGQEREIFMEASATGELMEEEIPDDEEEVFEATAVVAGEQEDEKDYAEKLWSQVDSSENC